MTAASKPGPLTAPFAEFAGTLDLPPSEPDEGEGAFDPLPSFEVPASRRVLTARDLAEAAIAAPGLHHAAGACGGATALVIRALASRTKRNIVAITADVESARALAADVSFVMGERDADDAEATGADAFGRVL